MTFDVNALNLNYVTDAVTIPKTGEDVPCTQVLIKSKPMTSNPKYNSMFIIEDQHGREGIVLVQNKLSHMTDLYITAKKNGDLVPVIVFGDDGGVAWPFTNADLRRWRENNPA